MDPYDSLSDATTEEDFDDDEDDEEDDEDDVENQVRLGFVRVRYLTGFVRAREV